MHGGTVQPRPVTPMNRTRPSLPCFNRRFQRPAWSQRQVPVIRVKQGVELNQIDGIDTQAFERPMDLLTRVLVEAFPGLGSEKEVLTMLCHPWANTRFSVPIAGRDIDMINTVFEEDVEHTIRLCLGGATERRCPKERDCAQVSGVQTVVSQSWHVPFPCMFVPHILMQPDYPTHEGRVKSGLLPCRYVRLSRWK